MPKKAEAIGGIASCTRNEGERRDESGHRGGVQTCFATKLPNNVTKQPNNATIFPNNATK
jgi:hypothetical protein